MTNAFKKRMEKLAQETGSQNEKYMRKELPNDIKICPFQSSPDCEVPCTNRCALFRGNKTRGFECPLSELTSMSWHIKGQPQRGGGSGGYGR